MNVCWLMRGKIPRGVGTKNLLDADFVKATIKNVLFLLCLAVSKVHTCTLTFHMVIISAKSAVSNNTEIKNLSMSIGDPSKNHLGGSGALKKNLFTYVYQFLILFIEFNIFNKKN